MRLVFKRSISLVLVAMLAVGLLAVNVSAAQVDSFTDIDSNTHTYAIQELNKAGIMLGVGSGKFEPDSPASRAMAITVLGRMAQAEEESINEFSDVDNRSWYAGYVNWAARSGIVLGNGTSSFQPNVPVTGEQFGLMLERYAELVNVEYNSDSKTDAILTRAELAGMAYRLYVELNGAVGTQAVVIKGEDWGPAVHKTVIKLDKVIAANSVNEKSFCVIETRESFSYVTFSAEVVTSPRNVVAAYVSDNKGNKVEQDSAYITLEMTCDEAAGYPFVNNSDAQSRYSKFYNLAISLTEGNTLITTDGIVIKTLAISSVNLDEAIIPDLDGVDLTGKFVASDGKALCYASYVPDHANDGQKHPLVIWIHGMGEGGEDPSIALLGNKATALLKDEFQNLMGGAYVLAPQTTGFWLQYDEDDLSKWNDNPGIPSIYATALMELIEDYVDKHPNIDTDRIIIGGCSNGGYMTMNIVLQNPDYFAAAFPICEAYMDSGISDTQMEALKNLPIWFVWAEDDFLVDPDIYEKPTIARLEKLGADVHYSTFSTGGHASWVYFFNNQCMEENVNMWQWLAQQHR